MLRAKALLMAADGEANTRVAEEVGVTPVTVRSWRQRFSADGLAGLGKPAGGRCSAKPPAPSAWTTSKPTGPTCGRRAYATQWPLTEQR